MAKDGDPDSRAAQKDAPPLAGGNPEGGGAAEKKPGEEKE